MKKIVINKNYSYDTSTPETIKNSKIWRTNPNEFESKFNDPTQYIIGNKNETDEFNFPIEILEEYPEYLAGWETTITNTGLVCFYDSSKAKDNFVIYDMFDDDINEDAEKDGFLDNIKPDISMLKMYNMFDQPLSVRKINFTDSKFTPERSYVYNNKWCGFFNCDGVNNNTTLNDNFFFEFEGDKPDVENIQFNYKPLFIFKIYNTDGSKKISSDLKILIDGKEAEADSEGGFYFIDLSNYKIENKSLLPLQISISLQDCDNGYLEVI